MYRPVIYFTLNKPQARINMVMCNEMWFLAGRGTGKTVGVIAPWILHKVTHMPRSNGGLIGQTFIDLETKILQPIFLAFQMLGYEKDVHYVYGKKPPEHWEKPLTPIVKYDRVLSFPNGTTMELISLHEKGSANGKSVQWIVADEAKLLNENQLRQEVFPILRGHVKHFGNSPWYGAKLFVSDKYSPSLHWILEKRKLHNEKLVNAIIYYQLEYNELQIKLVLSDNEHTANVIRGKMRALDKLLCDLRRQTVYFGEASALDNLENLSEDFIENMRRSLTDYEFRISILNEDPTRAENGFYPDRTEDHLYTSWDDEDETQPIGIVTDYQSSISPIVSFQVNDRVIPGVRSLNFLKDFYVKHPLGLKHVVDDFCKYHKDRACKHVYYFYDHTAVADRNMHGTYYEEVEGYFKANHWKVTLIYMGAAPNHGIKYNKIKLFFQNEELKYFPIRIHRSRCSTMVIAMDQTGTKETEQGTKKNKDSEKNKLYPQEQSTHFPDCFDQAVWAVNELGLYPSPAAAAVVFAMR